MRKFLMAVVAVLAIGATTLAASSPASAWSDGYGWRGGWAGAPVRLSAAYSSAANSLPDWRRRIPPTPTPRTTHMDLTTVLGASGGGTATTGSRPATEWRAL